MTQVPGRIVIAVVWLICGLLIVATLSRQCAYEPVAPHEFEPTPKR